MVSRHSNRKKGARNVKTRSQTKCDTKTIKNAESPLLRLPLELKTRIYEYVCGGQTVHIDLNCSANGLMHQICIASFSEEEAQEAFDMSEELWYEHDTAFRHKDCYDSLASHPRRYPHLYPHIGRLPVKKLETSFQRCCRQMYLEANLVLYHSTTFAFHSADLLIEFIHSIPEESRLAVRSLHVHVSVTFGDRCPEEDWHKAFEVIADSLKGLQRLYLTIELFPGKSRRLSRRKDHGKMPEEKSILGSILPAGKLNLKVTTVVLSDRHFPRRTTGEEVSERDAPDRWTLAQKQEWSRYLRRALLHYGDRDSDLAKVKREALEQGRICRL